MISIIQSSSEENPILSESMDQKSEENPQKKQKIDTDLTEDIAKKDDSNVEKGKDYLLTYCLNQGTGHTGFLTVAVIYE